MDVEHGDGRRRAIDALEAALDRRCSGYAGGTKSAQDILGVKRDDEAVLDEQDGPSRSRLDPVVLSDVRGRGAEI